jgi:hypothetical protein
VGRTEKQKNNHDPVFTTKVAFRVRATDIVRLALLEVEEESRLDEQGLVGEAFVNGEELIKNKPQTLRLTKDGKHLHDTFVLVNPTPETLANNKSAASSSAVHGGSATARNKRASPVEAKTTATGVTYTFQAAVRGFPILSRGRPMVAFFDVVEKKEGEEQKAGVIGHEYKQIGKTELAQYVLTHILAASLASSQSHTNRVFVLYVQ